MKDASKTILVVALIFTGVWVYGWYMGKNTPSIPDTTPVAQGEAVAYFAGGCFWCTESDYEKLSGVKEAVSGYMGGNVDNPSYNQVVQGGTGHREVVKVLYDPSKVTYRRLVLELLRETDPTDAGGTFHDRGYQYTSAIYYQSDKEKEIAEQVIQEVEDRKIFDAPIVTSIEPAQTFWIAEAYHQDYYKKSSLPYTHYRKGSGRDAFIELIWGSGEYDDLFETSPKEAKREESKEDETIEKVSVSRWQWYQKPNDETLRKTLTALQYNITQKEGTERPFQNEYWDNHDEGLYVDIVSGEPLFSSTEKFDSGTGWPSFLKPIDYDFVIELPDYKLIARRTEIRSTYADSHLGHIILDGPIENDKIRYCMNSAALRFVPKADLESEDLSEYLYLFS